jgi:TnpA family transposase
VSSRSAYQLGSAGHSRSKRLGAYPRQNGQALALGEIGRIERTLFTLDWLLKPELRR